ncbi:hypothetical protein GCM10027456_79160 [Kineosporia babensis]
MLVEFSSTAGSVTAIQLLRSGGSREHPDRAPRQAGTAHDLPERELLIQKVMHDVPPFLMARIETGHGACIDDIERCWLTGLRWVCPGLINALLMWKVFF